MAAALNYAVQYRYVLRSRAGVFYTFRDGRPLTWPSYMSALRGRAMIDIDAHIIQQQQQEQPLHEVSTCS